ncbi:MAG: condensation domain-containing protein [Candidatus Acidiferrales bacterium]
MGTTPGPTLSEAKRRLLEKLIKGDPAQSPASNQTITPRPEGETTPLGLAQEQVCRRNLRARGKPPLYNETITVHRKGPLEPALLERCFTEILRRHEVWRSSFLLDSSQYVQVIHPAPFTMKIPVLDLRDLPGGEREAEAARLASEQAQKPFDLEQGPLLRPLLLKMDDASCRIIVIAHQSIVDGVSAYQVLPTELAALYEAYSTGMASPLPELKIQYGDFARWQRQWLQGETRNRQLMYWEKQLAGELPILRWPQMAFRPSSESFRGVVHSFTSPPGFAEMVRDRGHAQGATPFMVLLAGFTALLHIYTEQNDILVGTLSPAGRKRSEVQGLLGYFLNPVALRYTISTEFTFRDLLLETRRLISEAISNDDVPLEFVAEQLNLKSSRDPFVKVALSLQPQVPTVESGWNVTSMDAQSGGTVWDLYLAFIEGEHGLEGRAQYNPDIFEGAVITAMLGDLHKVIWTGVSDPTRRVKDLLQNKDR